MCYNIQKGSEIILQEKKRKTEKEQKLNYEEFYNNRKNDLDHEAIGKVEELENGGYYKAVSKRVSIFGDYETVKNATLESMRSKIGGIENMPPSIAKHIDFKNTKK